jgi:hypothetical protein
VWTALAELRASIFFNLAFQGGGFRFFTFACEARYHVLRIVTQQAKIHMMHFVIMGMCTFVHRVEGPFLKTSAILASESDAATLRINRVHYLISAKRPSFNSDD